MGQIHGTTQMIGRIKFTLVSAFQPKAQFRAYHGSDHCIDYLRQVLMCHSDVTPITHKKRPAGYNPALADWVPNFSTPHTCRNFQKIHDWAKKYNTSGYVIESWPGIDPVAELRGNAHEH
jgi:Mycotoxin biosynthesis protein UstYa